MRYRMTPQREAKKMAMRGRLMAAATKLFAENGYEATTLQQIVKEAHTSIGNCYFYFANKEALLLAIAEDLQQEISHKIDATIESLPLGPGLLAMAVYVGTLATLERAEIARFALTDATHPGLRAITMELFTSRVERALQAMPSLFAVWPEASPQIAAAAWHGAANYVLESAMTDRITDDPRQIARFLAQWNLQALGFSNDAITQAMKTLQLYEV